MAQLKNARVLSRISVALEAEVALLAAAGARPGDFSLVQNPGGVQHAGAGFDPEIHHVLLADHGVQHDQRILRAQKPHARRHAHGFTVDFRIYSGQDGQRAALRLFGEGASAAQLAWHLGQGRASGEQACGAQGEQHCEGRAAKRVEAGAADHGSIQGLKQGILGACPTSMPQNAKPRKRRL